MKYNTPKLIAKNNPKGSFAAGCPSNDRGYSSNNGCAACDRVL